MVVSSQECDWDTARKRALASPVVVDAVDTSLEEAVGSVLAAPLRTHADIPAYDTAQHDGWAVSGPGPWRIRHASRRDLFSGMDYYDSTTHTRILDGQATPITEGEAVGPGVTAVVSSRRVRIDEDLIMLIDHNRRNRVELGSGIRPRASDAHTGEVLVRATERVTPAVAALAALAGNDVLTVFPMPRVGVVRIGEVLERGVPRHGLARDAVAPALSSWIAGLGGRCEPPRWVISGDAELIDVIEDVTADIIVTTGPGAGAAIRRILPTMRAEIIVDGILCNPGESALLATFPDGRHLIHCGEVPLDAVAVLVTLLAPLIESMSGRQDPARRLRIQRMLVGDRNRTSLLPGRFTGERGQDVEIVTPGGPGGLFALAAADCLVVIPPGGVAANEPVTVLPMP